MSLTGVVYVRLVTILNHDCKRFVVRKKVYCNRTTVCINYFFQGIEKVLWVTTVQRNVDDTFLSLYEEFVFLSTEISIIDPKD